MSTDEDVAKFLWMGWRGAPTQLVLKQIDKITKDSGLRDIVIDWQRATEPECDEVTIIYKPKPGLSAQQVGWSL